MLLKRTITVEIMMMAMLSAHIILQDFFFSVVPTKEGVVCFIKQAQMKHINCNKGFNVILCLLMCLFNDYSVFSNWEKYQHSNSNLIKTA